MSHSSLLHWATLGRRSTNVSLLPTTPSVNRLRIRVRRLQKLTVLGNFSKLINHDGDVEVSDIKTWNSRGQYDDVVKAVQECGDGNHVIKVFRVDHGGSRCEYYVVILNKDGNVVGVRAKAVES